MFPAGLPTTIAAVELAGANALQVMIGVNVLCAGALVLLTFAIGTLLCRGPGSGLVSAALVAASIYLPGTFRMLWSEPVFSVAVMVVLGVLVAAIRRRRLRGRGAATLVVAANVAALYRYIGLALLPAIFLGVWWAGAGRSRGSRLRDAGLITAGAAAGATVNLLRNAAVGEDLTGPRYGSQFEVTSAAWSFARAFANPFVGQRSALLISLAVALAVANLLVGCLGAWRARDSAFAFVLVAFVCYSGALVMAEVGTRLDPIGDRLFVPLVAPASLLLGYGCASAWRWQSGARRAPDASAPGAGHRGTPLRVLAILTVTLAVAAAAVQTVTSAQHVSGRRTWANPATNTPLTQAVRGLPPEAGVASNSPAQLWARTGRVPIELLPGDDYYWPPDRVADYQHRLEQRVASGEITYVAVFNGRNSSAEGSVSGQPEVAVATLDQLRGAGFDVQSVETLADGVLYRVTPPA